MEERVAFLMAYARHPASNVRELPEYAGPGKRKEKPRHKPGWGGQIHLPKEANDVIY